MAGGLLHSITIRQISWSKDVLGVLGAVDLHMLCGKDWMGMEF
jgi:hypothetical protein